MCGVYDSSFEIRSTIKKQSKPIECQIEYESASFHYNLKAAELQEFPHKKKKYWEKSR